MCGASPRQKELAEQTRDQLGRSGSGWRDHAVSGEPSGFGAVFAPHVDWSTMNPPGSASVELFLDDIHDGVEHGVFTAGEHCRDSPFLGLEVSNG